MHLKQFFILPVLLSSFHTWGQTIALQSLIDTATRSGGLFVSAKPITRFSLDKGELSSYYYNLKDYNKVVLDTVMFLQIINNSKNADTTWWNDKELKRSILIGNRGETVRLKAAIQKFYPAGKKETMYYRKQIHQFNSTETSHKNIYSYSRPVFDSSKQFAIVQWDNAHSGLGGGGAITLYQFTGNAWQEKGNIMFWKY